VLRLLLKGTLKTENLRFYEDLPYAARNSYVKAKNEIESALGTLAPVEVNITEKFDIKKYLCSLYISQVTDRTLHEIQRHASSFQAGQYKERQWRVKA